MKKIYPKGQKREYMRIRKKILRMEKDGLFIYVPNENRFILISDLVKLRKMKFPDRKISDALYLKINNKWEIFQL